MSIVSKSASSSIITSRIEERIVSNTPQSLVTEKTEIESVMPKIK